MGTPVSLKGKKAVPASGGRLREGNWCLLNGQRGLV